MRDLQLNDAQVRALLKVGSPGKFRVDHGLYFRVSQEKSGFWVLRYSIRQKRRELTIGRYGKPPEGIPLADAKLEAAKLRAEIRKGKDPLTERQRTSIANLSTVDEVARDWLEEARKRIKNAHIPERVYARDIAPRIGPLPVTEVNARDILSIVREVRDSGRPTVANDVLTYCKNLFNHAIKLDLTRNNPAQPLTITDAGGPERQRDRALSLDEIASVLTSLRSHQDQFSRENYLATVLLLCLGARKGELTAAEWSEFDLEESLWHLPAKRSKSGEPITFPLHPKILDILGELKIRSCGSAFVFPNRRKSKRFGHMSPDTLNAAMNKMFNQGKLRVQHFTIHDFRRTFRTILAQLGTPPHIAERCLNHKQGRIEGIYDRYDYMDERKRAHWSVVERLAQYL